MRARCIASMPFRDVRANRRSRGHYLAHQHGICPSLWYMLDMLYNLESQILCPLPQDQVAITVVLCHLSNLFLPPFTHSLGCCYWTWFLVSVLGSWFLVLGSRFSVLGSRFLVLGSLFFVLCSWFFAPLFFVLGSWFLVLGSLFLVLRSFVLRSPLRPSRTGRNFFWIDERHHPAQLATDLLNRMFAVGSAHAVEVRTTLVVLLDPLLGERTILNIGQ